MSWSEQLARDAVEAPGLEAKEQVSSTLHPPTTLLYEPHSVPVDTKLHDVRSKPLSLLARPAIGKSELDSTVAGHSLENSIPAPLPLSGQIPSREHSPVQERRGTWSPKGPKSKPTSPISAPATETLQTVPNASEHFSEGPIERADYSMHVRSISTRQVSLDTSQTPEAPQVAIPDAHHSRRPQLHPLLISYYDAAGAVKSSGERLLALNAEFDKMTKTRQALEEQGLIPFIPDEEVLLEYSAERRDAAQELDRRIDEADELKRLCLEEGLDLTQGLRQGLAQLKSNVDRWMEVVSTTVPDDHCPPSPILDDSDKHKESLDSAVELEQMYKAPDQDAPRSSTPSITVPNNAAHVPKPSSGSMAPRKPNPDFTAPGEYIEEGPPAPLRRHSSTTEVTSCHREEPAVQTRRPASFPSKYDLRSRAAEIRVASPDLSNRLS